MFNFPSKRKTQIKTITVTLATVLKSENAKELEGYGKTKGSSWSESVNVK